MEVIVGIVVMYAAYLLIGNLFFGRIDRINQSEDPPPTMEASQSEPKARQQDTAPDHRPRLVTSTAEPPTPTTPRRASGSRAVFWALVVLALSGHLVVSQTSEGTVCRDGWVSSSTGRGTCSWHGGVRGYRVASPFLGWFQIIAWGSTAGAVLIWWRSD